MIAIAAAFAFIIGGAFGQHLTYMEREHQMQEAKTACDFIKFGKENIDAEYLSILDKRIQDAGLNCSLTSKKR